MGNITSTDLEKDLYNVIRSNLDELNHVMNDLQPRYFFQTDSDEITDEEQSSYCDYLEDLGRRLTNESMYFAFQLEDFGVYPVLKPKNHGGVPLYEYVLHSWAGRPADASFEINSTNKEIEIQIFVDDDTL